MALPIGGFMPIPLAMMIPFMATQSMVMGDAFGRAFQYGKRKISAMSNEEFNKTSLEQQASEMFKAYKIIIGDSHLQDAIRESNALQRMIIEEMIKIIPDFVASLTGKITKDVDTIQTLPQDHSHSIDRPHTHSGTKTIIGSTTTNGITTTHYSDGTSTKSGQTILNTPPTTPPTTGQTGSRTVSSPDKNFPNISKYQKFTILYGTGSKTETLEGFRGLIKALLDLAIKNPKFESTYTKTIMSINSQLSQQIGQFFY